MKETKIIREALKTCNWTQTALAEKMGYTDQACVASRLSGNSMRVDTFVKMLEVMGYEVVVKSTSPTLNKNTWKVTVGEAAASED